MGENNLIIVKFDIESMLKLCMKIETNGQIKKLKKKTKRDIFIVLYSKSYILSPKHFMKNYIKQ